jgi:putative phosphoribosyl transferase
VAATDWIQTVDAARGLRIGYFGASTGGGAALVAAAKAGERVGAVVSRGGRPDLASAWLSKVKSPTLLLVGELDNVVIGLNREAMQHMSCITEMRLIPDATHLFEEPGALEAVAHDAAEWFGRYLPVSPS